MKPLIIAIVGPSGSGKTELTKHIYDEADIPSVISWTTREMRPGETDGIEHWFTTADKMPYKSSMIAYTKFGDFEYWVTSKDIENCGSIMTYIIDEDGLILLQKKHGSRYNIVPVLVRRDYQSIVECVGKERVDRDINRIPMDDTNYEYIINNNGTLEDFLSKGISTVCEIIKKYGSTNNR